jgi:hypothetical protein
VGAYGLDLLDEVGGLYRGSSSFEQLTHFDRLIYRYLSIGDRRQEPPLRFGHALGIVGGAKVEGHARRPPGGHQALNNQPHGGAVPGQGHLDRLAGNGLGLTLKQSLGGQCGPI